MVSYQPPAVRAKELSLSLSEARCHSDRPRTSEELKSWNFVQCSTRRRHGEGSEKRTPRRLPIPKKASTVCAFRPCLPGTFFLLVETKKLGTGLDCFLSHRFSVLPLSLSLPQSRWALDLRDEISARHLTHSLRAAVGYCTLLQSMKGVRELHEHNMI